MKDSCFPQFLFINNQARLVNFYLSQFFRHYLCTKEQFNNTSCYIIVLESIVKLRF